ncbi:MAG TPA: hypothetical protein VH682_27310 [Gemmataceae bacterium]
MMRVAKTLPVLLLLPLVVAADEQSPPKGWKEMAPKNKAYIAWYPSDGKIEESQDSIVSPKFGQIRIFRAHLERKDGSLFGTSQIILPPKLLKANAKVRQDFFRDVCLEEFRGKVVEEKKAKLGTMAGKEYLIKTPGGMARFGLYGTGSQTFRVLIVGSKDQVQSKDADTFFTSFKRTPKTTPKDK